MNKLYLILSLLVIQSSLKYTLSAENEEEQKIQIELELKEKVDDLEKDYAFLHKDPFEEQKDLYIDSKKVDSFTTSYKFETSGKHNITIVFSSPLTDMNSLFLECDHIISVTFIDLKEAKITDMTNAFASCKKLKTVKGFKFLDTSEVSKMTSMFSGCESITDLDLSSLKTDSLTDMTSMFENFKSKNILDLSSFDLKDTITYNNIFNNSVINEIKLPNQVCDQFIDLLMQYEKSFKILDQCEKDENNKFICQKCEEINPGCKICGNEESCKMCNAEKGFEFTFHKCFVKRNTMILLVFLVVVVVMSTGLVFGVIFWAKAREAKLRKKESEFLNDNAEANEENKLTKSGQVEHKALEENDKNEEGEVQN